MTAGHDRPTSVVVARVVHPGKECEFAEWADQIDAATARFDGYLGRVRLHDTQGVNYLIYQFDSSAHLRAWETSPRRRALINEGNRVSDERRSTATDTDNWFTVPGNSAAQRSKTFVLTWAAAYPILLLISTGLRAVLPSLPQPVLLLVTSGTLTAVLTWVVMPAVTRRVRPWLLRGAHAEPRRGPH